MYRQQLRQVPPLLVQLLLQQYAMHSQRCRPRVQLHQTIRSRSLRQLLRVNRRRRPHKHNLHRSLHRVIGQRTWFTLQRQPSSSVYLLSQCSHPLFWWSCGFVCRKHALTLQLHTAHIISAQGTLDTKNKALQDIKEQKNKLIWSVLLLEIASQLTLLTRLESERSRLLNCLREVCIPVGMLSCNWRILSFPGEWRPR